MEGIKLTDLCKQIGCEREELDAMVKKLGMGTFKVFPNAWAVYPNAAKILVRELTLPDELQGGVYKAQALHKAQNKRYWFCKIDGIENKHPVLLSSKLKAHICRGKRFEVERIEDAKGVTWRDVNFRKISGYDR